MKKYKLTFMGKTIILGMVLVVSLLFSKQIWGVAALIFKFLLKVQGELL